MGRLIQIDEFETLRGTSFRLQKPDGGEQTVLLESVTPLGDQGVGKRPKAFSLIFRPPEGESPLPQATYELRHESADRMEIFLVPIQPDEKGFRYEAIFS